MSECKNRRATKPFKAAAIAAANKAQPTANCYSEQKKWMNAYSAAGGAWECADPAAKRPGDIKEKCPLDEEKKREEQEKMREAMMQRITDGKSKLAVTGSDDFKKKTLDSIEKLSKTPTGYKLLKGLDGASKSTTIVETSGGNTENAASWNDGLYDTTNRKAGPGSNASVEFNPDRDKLNGEDWQTRDPAIGLGHELIHAYHDTRGTTDGRVSVEYQGPQKKKHAAPGYELQAVGLGEHANETVSENKLRRDFCNQGLSSKGTESKRPKY